MMEQDRKIPDYLGSYRESKALAHKIRMYWSNRGYEVNVYVEKFKLDPTGSEYFQIRSDINLKGA
jgi:hypothetical protein